MNFLKEFVGVGLCGFESLPPPGTNGITRCEFQIDYEMPGLRFRPFSEWAHCGLVLHAMVYGSYPLLEVGTGRSREKACKESQSGKDR